MSALFSGGGIFLVILGLTVVEALALVLWRGRTGMTPAAILFHLGAGAFIVLAAFLTIAGAGWGWAGLCLVLSGLLHVVDLRRRMAP